MNLQVKHSLRYEYDKSVSLDPHTLYLYPRAYPHQKVLDYTLTLQPEPFKVVRNVDVEGNVQQIIYFNQPTDQLLVEASLVLSSDEVNVFDFVLFPFETKNIPFQYPEHIQKYLAPYLNRSDVTSYVEQFARKMAYDAQWETVPFLMALSRYMYEHFTYEVREVGDAHSPETTLLNRFGSCRDYARLFMASCRSLGLAARFVSGYLYGSPQQEHELHAWAEVYLPGAGWRGFDPTEGKAVANHHISLGASADYDRLAPVMGTFRGMATSLLTTEVSITQV
ncbi:transglutaminase family protein [Rhabdobacter roseus]|uniref:Transglutaminase-like putative cysteine protease n=1 Tax=Rhabdobacter roseus TaxID=1655419 RepID=A0A840TTK2_9BACT|nr:transglutaminase family protein [Rhabdobacter roseus]MBB5284997.1 transglutaminase-like putative cysteine protease [Rhabdobacter roseus]